MDIDLNLLYEPGYNYRKHPDQQIKNLAKSLETFGQRRTISVWPDGSGKYEVLAGNGITFAARVAGWKTLDCTIAPQDWDATQRKAYAAADNQGGAEDDQLMLAQLLEEVNNDGRIQLDALGSSKEQLQSLLDSLGSQMIGEKPGAGGDEFDEEKEEIPERCKPGDLWACGPHKLLIGDCRNPADMAWLLGSEKINVVVTSPPYASQREYDKESGFTPIKPEKYLEWFESVQANIADYLAKDGSYFLNIKEHCEDGQRHLYVKDLTIAHVRRWGWRFVDEFCWRDTRNGVPGRWSNRFKDAWEPVFHFVRNSKIKFNPESVGTESNDVFAYSANNAKASTGSGLLGSDKESGYFQGVALPSNVLEIPTATTGNHTAPFPVELPDFFIKAFSDENDLIFDPFLGSGTTMIAADRNNRKCYGTELSAKYGDVILARYETETGQIARLMERVENG